MESEFSVFFLNTTSLYLAIKLNNIEIVKLLLSNKNIDINAHYAVTFKNSIQFNNII